MKRCSKCGESKPLREFYRNAGKKDGVQSQCKICAVVARKAWDAANKERLKVAKRDWGVRNQKARRRAEGRYRYGIDDLDEFFETEGNRCALCEAGSSERRLVVDHDHKTGAIRGVLCSRCNGALGALGDDLTGVERAIAYLNRPPRLNGGGLVMASVAVVTS